MTAMYKFLTYEEWMATETVKDEEGNETEQRTCPSYFKHPNARVNYEKTEVVISCNYGGAHTKEEALAYIQANWEAPASQEV